MSVSGNPLIWDVSVCLIQGFSESQTEGLPSDRTLKTAVVNQHAEASGRETKEQTSLLNLTSSDCKCTRESVWCDVTHSPRQTFVCRKCSNILQCKFYHQSPLNHTQFIKKENIFKNMFHFKQFSRIKIQFYINIKTVCSHSLWLYDSST